MRANLLIITTLFLSTFCLGQRAKFQGQGPIQRVATKTKPTQPQWKGVFELPNDIFVSNDFSGARLNGLTQVEGDTIVALITPENTPINPSPWYAFKIWSKSNQRIILKLTYQDGKHRYYPKVSENGSEWHLLDSTKFQKIKRGTERFGPKSQSESALLFLKIGPNPIWVAAQELESSTQVFNWMDKMAENDFISIEEIGKSREGRSIKCMKIGETDDEKMMMVISRQHPPEVTGYLAMKAFIETIAGDSKLAKKFRKQYNLYVVPLMNPDGVDNGHWRHNNGGIDLNRDWADFNQPETTAVKDFMHRKMEEANGKFYFGIDFHSTWDDIYYTIPVESISNLPNFTTKWLNGVKSQFTDWEPNVKPTDSLEPTLVSRNYFFIEFGAEALVYEVGDNTPRDFLKRKGQVSAEQLMKIVLEEY